jgi:hypothetical protein
MKIYGSTEVYEKGELRSHDFFACSSARAWPKWKRSKMPSAYTLTGRAPELTDVPPAASGDDGGEDIGSYHTTVCAAAVSSSAFFIGTARS